MKARRVITIAVLVLFVLGSVTAYAQRGGGFGHGPKGNPGDDGCFGTGMRRAFMEELDLTADQIKQMKDLRLEAHKKIIPLKADMKLARLEMMEMIRDGATENQVNAKIDQMSSIRTDIQKIKVGVHLKIRNLLTDEQKEKMESMPFGPGHGGPGMRGHHGRGFGMDSDCPMMGEGPGGFGMHDCPWDENI